MNNIINYAITIALGAVELIGFFVAAFFLLDKLTPQIDFWKELKRKNLAVAVFLGALMIALAIVIRG